MKILGTGLGGMVGSRVLEILDEVYEFETSTADITKEESITQEITASSAQAVFHFAAKTDVDACEKDKEEDEVILEYPASGKIEKELIAKKTAWAVNVLGARNIARACLRSGKKLFYISTDFVFDGTKNDSYTEEDNPNPINWYGRTKYEAEEEIRSTFDDYVIARIAYPYRAEFEKKRDFVRSIISRLEEGKEVQGVTNHIFTPTFVDDIAEALRACFENKQTGTFHVVGSQFLSPYDAALLIAEKFGFSTSLIKKVKREVFFKDKAPRPFRLVLKNDKIKKLGVRMRTFEEGLSEIKNEI